MSSVKTDNPTQTHSNGVQGTETSRLVSLQSLATTAMRLSFIKSTANNLKRGLDPVVCGQTIEEQVTAIEKALGVHLDQPTYELEADINDALNTEGT